MNYEEMMNGAPTEPITWQNIKKLTPGTLIGWKAFSKEDRITAAYPVQRVSGDDVRFLLINRPEKQVYDGTRIGDQRDVFVNVSPIVVNLFGGNPSSFVSQVVSLFNGDQDPLKEDKHKWVSSADGKTKIYQRELPKEAYEKNWTNWVYKHRFGDLIRTDEIPDDKIIRVSYGIPITSDGYDSVEVRVTKSFLKGKLFDELMEKVKTIDQKEWPIIPSYGGTMKFLREVIYLDKVLKTGTI